MKMDVNFGHVAKNYAQYRNDLPDELLKSLTLRGISFEGKKVVDLGCGTGVLSRALQKEGANVVGVEPALALIEEALTIDAKKVTVSIINMVFLKIHHYVRMHMR